MAANRTRNHPAHGCRTGQRAGFTLIELIMVIMLLGILAAAAAPLMVNAFKAFETNQSNRVTLGKLRYATERIAREIREVRYTGGAYTMVMNPTSLQITKNDAANTVVTITSAVPLVTLQYSTPPMSATLTNQLAAGGLQFVYYDIDNNSAGVTTTTVAYVDVSLTLTDPISGAAQQRTRIALRNR